MRMQGGAGHCKSMCIVQRLHFKRARLAEVVYMIDLKNGCQLQKAETPLILLNSLLVVALGIQ